jgi:transcription antitermination factor NusG
MPYLEPLSTSSGTEIRRFPWFALQVRSRREGLITAHLEGQGYECFLPLYKSKRRWSDRVKEIEQPLFPGYLFCRFDLHNRGPLLMTPGVQQIVGIARTPMAVEEKEIEAIRLALSSGLPNQPWPYMQVGERVRVNYGSLVNLEGILVNFKGSNRVVLSVTLLQRSVAMEIEMAWVSPVREAKAVSTSRALGERRSTVEVAG